MSTWDDLELDDLRTERRRLAEEVGRLSWLRRLVVARSDLEVARLTGVRAEVGEVPDVVRDALALHVAASGPELLGALSASVRTLGERAGTSQHRLDSATRELVDRYSADPTRCLTAARP